MYCDHAIKIAWLAWFVFSLVSTGGQDAKVERDATYVRVARNYADVCSMVESPSCL